MKMKEAYIFDFDGVLANTMEAHFCAYSRAIEQVGAKIDRKQFYHQAGMTGIEQIKYFLNQSGVEADPQTIYEQKRLFWPDYFDRISVIENNVNLAKLLGENGHPLAIASGSTKPSILGIMEVLKIDLPISVIVSAEDIKRGKPNPELFLTSAQRLNMAPENCIVIEDSDVGILAAQRAGMKVMRFYDNTNVKENESG